MKNKKLILGILLLIGAIAFKLSNLYPEISNSFLNGAIAGMGIGLIFTSKIKN